MRFAIPRESREVYQQKLADGDDPDVIAKRLTLAIWRSSTGTRSTGATWLGSQPLLNFAVSTKIH